jgi:hypothetical protein
MQTIAKNTGEVFDDFINAQALQHEHVIEHLLQLPLARVIGILLWLRLRCAGFAVRCRNGSGLGWLIDIEE